LVIAVSDRIDHAAEAWEFQQASQLVAGDSMEAATLAVRHAHVHAVLALVEQTRIANLIALSQAEDGNGWISEQAIASVFREHWNDETGQGHSTIAPEVAAALGIKTGEDDE
jgi:hypothetical protein